MMFFLIKVFGGFNTQPPEGGWERVRGDTEASRCFNTQPPEGGWALDLPQLSP